MKTKTILRSNRLAPAASKAPGNPDDGLIFSPGLANEDVCDKARRLNDSCPDAFLRLIRYSPNAISILNADGYLQAVNMAFITMFGEMPQGEYNFFEDPVLLELGFEEMFSRLRHGETVSTPFKIWYDCRKSFAKNSSGKIYLAGTAIPISNDQGLMEYIVVICTDSTELVYKARALSESEQKYRDLVEQAGIAIMMVNLKGHIFYNNETLASLFGYSMEELRDKPLLDLVHPDEREKFLTMQSCRKRESQSRFQYEFRGIRKDGSEVYISVNGTTLSENGKIIGCRSYLADITKQKKAEFALKEYNTSLEFQVRKRTRQLHESVQNLEKEREALLQKNIALEEVLNQIEDVKKRMAHQIQTNLSRQAMPILNILERKACDESAGDIRLLRKCLDEAASPFVSAVDLRFPLLTPREIGICNMIRNGLSSKEIAEVFKISPQTVFKQRKIIRKKLGISGKNFNLEAYIKLIR